MTARLIVLLLMLVALSPLAFAAKDDERCRQLRELEQQYRGVSRATFTETMRDFERRLRGWYARNCR